MKIALLATALLTSTAIPAADQLPEFDVASVKLAPPRKPGEPRGRIGCTGGPGSADPVRLVCSNASVSILVIEAFEVKPYQIRPPVANDTQRFQIEAKVPAGATRRQLQQMLQRLLAERFRLVFHREKTDTPGYALIVGKSGARLKPSSDTPPAETPSRPITDPDGFTYIPMRNAMAVGRANGMTRWVGNHVPLDWLAGLLNSLTGQPVVDSTGLAGDYDFTLTFGSDAVGEAPAPSPVPAEGGAAAESGLTVFAALEQQLGLRLERRKIPVDLFVIDSVEKSPSEN